MIMEKPLAGPHPINWWWTKGENPSLPPRVMSQQPWDAPSYGLRARKHDFGPSNPGRFYRDHEFCTEICAILSHMSVLPCISFLLGCISASVCSGSAAM